MSAVTDPGSPSGGRKTNESVEKKRHREEALLNEMIRLYCRKRHASRGGLCEECRELAAYAHERIERCPFTQTKTFCSSCPVHCYRRQMREKIRAVMRFSGPRMLLRHPLWAIKHAAVTLREKRKQKKPERRPFMKALLIGLGFLCVAVGAVGVVLPVLPTTPFLLLASFFFAKGSKRFHDRFLSTRLYKKHLESFVESRAMTLKSKLSILLPVSALLMLTFFLIDHLHVRILLVVLFIGKYLYFFTHIRTVTPEEERELKERLLEKKAAEAKKESEAAPKALCPEE